MNRKKHMYDTTKHTPVMNRKLVEKIAVFKRKF